MSTYQKNGISFNLNDDSWIQFPKMGNADSKFSRGTIEKLIHSVEIDWDGAVLPNADANTGGSKTINDTSELMALINTMQKEIYVLTAAVVALAQK